MCAWWTDRDAYPTIRTSQHLYLATVLLLVNLVHIFFNTRKHQSVRLSK